MAMRWRWPPEQLDAAIADMRIEPLGPRWSEGPSMKAQAPLRARRLEDFRVTGVGTPRNTMFSCDRA